MKRTSAQQAMRKHVVDMRFHRTCAIKGLTETGDSCICLDMDPKDIGEFCQSEGSDGGNFHGSAPEGDFGGDRRRAFCLRGSRAKMPKGSFRFGAGQSGDWCIDCGLWQHHSAPGIHEITPEG